jgi:hypothetical protein
MRARSIPEVDGPVRLWLRQQVENRRMPALNIEDPEAYRLASELARKTGRSLTLVVVDALRVENMRISGKKIDRARVESILDQVVLR